MHKSGLFRERTQVHLQCVDRHREFLVTWMMDLGKCSLDGHNLGNQDAFLGGLSCYYIVGTTST
jgi:hypothetical protein